MVRKWMLVVPILLALIAGVAPWIRAQQTGTLAIEGATLIDGTGAAPVSNSVIVIENGKISAIGRRSKVRIPAGARVIDAKGKYIIPGLISAHVHFVSWAGELYLNNGVTSIFDFGNDPDYIFSVRDAERSGKVKMVPRVFTVGRQITRPGGNGTPSFGANAGTPAPAMPPGTPHGPDWARQQVRERIAMGVNAIKVVSDNLDADEVKAITDEAHKAHLKVIGHVMDVYKYVDNGFDGVVHLWGVSWTLMNEQNRKKWTQDGAIMNPYAYMEPSQIEPLIKFMLNHHTALQPLLMNEQMGTTSRAPYFEAEVEKELGDPNLRYLPRNVPISFPAVFRRDRSWSNQVGEFPYLEQLSPELRAEAFRGYKNAVDFTVRYAKAGGLVWLGNDDPGSGTVPGMGIRQEIECLVDGGLSPMQAIQTATKNTAEMFNIGDQVGTLQVGRWGDVVILNGNPLSDIANIDKIHSVIKAGELLDGQFHPAYHPFYWRPQDDRDNTRTYSVPVLTSVSSEPDGRGGSAVTIIAKGSAFVGSSLIYFNGRPLETHLVNTGELRATLKAEEKPATGPYNITVATGWPGGGVSEAKAVRFE